MATRRQIAKVANQSKEREERSENIITSDGRDRRRENGEGSVGLRGNDKGTLTYSGNIICLYESS